MTRQKTAPTLCLVKGCTREATETASAIPETPPRWCARHLTWALNLKSDTQLSKERKAREQSDTSV